MILTLLQIIFFLEVLMFLTAVFMHLVHKNSSLILLYQLQSLIVIIFVFSSAIKISSILLIFVAILMFIVKVIIAPYFFNNKLIKNNQFKFSSSTYLNAPLTLLVIAALTGLVYSHYFKSLTILVKDVDNLFLALATILISIFLLINRKGVLSQMVGILSLENAIVSFAFFSGLEVTPNMQIGIIFDLLIWIIIVSILATMINEKFGTLDSTVMNNLREE